MVLDNKGHELSTDASIDFIVNDKRYEYSLSIDNRGIINEELSLFNNNQFDLVFQKYLIKDGEFGLKLGRGGYLPLSKSTI